MVNDNEKLTYSVEEAAERLGISPANVRIAIKQGKIPMLNLGNRKWRIPIAALNRYLANAGASGATNGKYYHVEN